MADGGVCQRQLSRRGRLLLVVDVRTDDPSSKRVRILSEPIDNKIKHKPAKLGISITYKDNAEGGTRTPTGCPIRPSNVRVYQFHHFGSREIFVNYPKYFFSVFLFWPIAFLVMLPEKPLDSMGQTGKQPEAHHQPAKQKVKQPD
jgi:hypothetical protein